jgi:hypothetical protein
MGFDGDDATTAAITNDTGYQAMANAINAGVAGSPG